MLTTAVHKCVTLWLIKHTFCQKEEKKKTLLISLRKILFYFRCYTHIGPKYTHRTYRHALCCCEEMSE